MRSKFIVYSHFSLGFITIFFGKITITENIFVLFNALILFTIDPKFIKLASGTFFISRCLWHTEYTARTIVLYDATISVQRSIASSYSRSPGSKRNCATSVLMITSLSFKRSAH